MTAVDDVLDYDPFAAEVMRDPMPFYARLRDEHPVYYVERYDTFFLSRFQDVWDFLVLGDNAFPANEGTVFTPADLARRNDGPTSDGPLTPFGSHLRYGSPTYDEVRHAHGAPLRPRGTASLEGAVRGIVRDRLDALLPTGAFDLTADLGGIVSASTICHLFRIPLEEAPDVLRTVHALTATDNDTPGFARSQDVMARLLGFMTPQVAERRSAGADGSFPLVDGMLQLRVDGRELTDTEIAVNLLCVFAGGTETVPKVFAHGLMELWRAPEQLAAVRADLAANVPKAVEEMLRFCAPAQWFGRTCRKESIVAGQVVRPGQRVVYLNQSASRDPREYDDPDTFRWDRRIARTLAFGRGQHFCIGVHLARLELAVLLEEFLARVPEYEIDLDGAHRPPSSFQWGYDRLPVRVHL